MPIRRRKARKGLTGTRSPALNKFNGTGTGGSASLIAPVRYAASSMFNPTLAFPLSRMCTMQYCETFQLTAANATGLFGSEQVFNLNGLFDPDLTGSGHQPYQYDQMTAIYNAYRVFEVAWEIQFTNPLAQSMYGAVSVQSSLDPYQLASQNFGQAREKHGVWAAALNQAAGLNTTRCIGSAKIWELDGVPFHQWLADDQYAAAFTANPVQRPFLRMAVGDFAAPVTGLGCRVIVNLTFKALFYKRHIAAQS